MASCNMSYLASSPGRKKSAKCKRIIIYYTPCTCNHGSMKTTKWYFDLKGHNIGQVAPTNETYVSQDFTFDIRPLFLLFRCKWTIFFIKSYNAIGVGMQKSQSPTWTIGDYTLQETSWHYLAVNTAWAVNDYDYNFKKCLNLN